MLAQAETPPEFDLAEEQRLASLALAAPHLDGYEIVELIGEGTYGDVWRARNTKSGVTVAIKRFRQQPDEISCDEVKKLARLAPARGIVALYDVHLASEPYCYVMEHLGGGTLADLIRRRKQIPLAEAWRIFRHLIEALCYVHGEGIVHCDIKPENVLLDSRGNPRLGDFGQARGRGPGGASLGTRFYMSPEQARLEGLSDPRWDVYALGALLYEMLTGDKPRYDNQLANLLSSPSGSSTEMRDRLEKYARHLEASPLLAAHRKVPGVDSSVARLIEQCLSLDFADRPRDAAAVLKLMAQSEHARASKPLLIFGGLAPAIMLLGISLTMFVLGRLTLSRLTTHWTELYKTSNPIVAPLVAHDVQQLFDARAEIVRRQAQAPDLLGLVQGQPPRSPLDKECQEQGLDAPHCRLKAIFNEHRQSIDRWALADATGRLIANYGSRPKDAPGVDRGSNGKNFAWRGWFNGDVDRVESLETARAADLQSSAKRRRTAAFVSQPYSRKGDDQVLVVAISCPLAPTDDSVPRGMLSGSLNYEAFFQSVQQIAAERAKGGQDVVIVNDKCQVLFHSNKRAWTAAGGSPFTTPRYEACELFKDALANPSAEQEAQPFAYRDPVDGHHCEAAVQVVRLASGQRLAVVVQQNNRLETIWIRGALWATALGVISITFLGTNSYALYWTLRRQREAAGGSLESSGNLAGSAAPQKRAGA